MIIDSRNVAETGPVSRNSLVYSTRAAASLAQYFLSRRDSVGLVIYGDEIVSVDRDTGKKRPVWCVYYQTGKSRKRGPKG